ncbi:MAG: hypothetical protein WC521_00545 [Bdellovibrionales bacterium]
MKRLVWVTGGCVERLAEKQIFQQEKAKLRARDVERYGHFH